MSFDLSVSEIEDLELEEIVSLVQDKAQPLIDKRDELLEENKSLKSDLGSKKDELKELREEVQKLDDEDLVEAEKVEEVRDKVESKYQEQLEEEQEEKQQYRSKLESEKIDNALSDALSEAGVAAPYIQPVKAQLRSDLTVVETDEDELQVVAGDGAMGKSVEERVDEFLENNGRDHYTSAPSNSGGGAGSDGGGGGGTGENPLDQSNDNFSMTEANKFVRENDDETVQQKLKEAEEPINIDTSVGAV